MTFHDVLYGFRANRGMGTAILEINMAQDLVIVSIDQDSLFLVFLDLRKSYSTLEHGRILHTLVGYGSGPKMRGLLAEFLENQ